MSSFCVVKINDKYEVEEQDRNDGYELESEALAAAYYLNNETFQYVAPLGKGTNKIGVTSKDKLDDDRDTHNEKVKRRFKIER